MNPYAHPEYLSLLAAILAKPDDDQPRLIVADWLEEHGEEGRAEFIRVQCRVARFAFDPCCKVGEFSADRAPIYGGHANGCEGCDIWRRETALLHGGGLDDWAPELSAGNPRKPWAFHWRFEGGFVERVTCTAAAWLAHADALLAAHPIRRVELTTIPHIGFGPIQRREEPTDFGVRLVAKWEANAGDGPLSFGLALNLDSRREAYDLSGGGREHFERGVEKARTPLAYLEARWPGIAFTLPAIADHGRHGVLTMPDGTTIQFTEWAFDPGEESPPPPAPEPQPDPAEAEAAKAPGRRRNSRRPDWLKTRRPTRAR